MEAHHSRTRWTYSEFARLPSEGSTRHEVIEDELVVTPAPTLRHQRIATDLVTLLNTFIQEHGLGEVYSAPVDVLLAEGDYLEPDIVFVREERSDLLSDRGVEGPPDLVVEITSPSTADRDRGLKLERYRHFAVAEYWIVDPAERSIEIWSLADGADAPVVHGPSDRLRWTPVEGGPTFEVLVARVIEDA